MGYTSRNVAFQKSFFGSMDTLWESGIGSEIEAEWRKTLCTEVRSGPTSSVGSPRARVRSRGEWRFQHL